MLHDADITTAERRLQLMRSNWRCGMSGDAVALQLADHATTVAAMTASMGGVDAIVFTGGIGENGARVRKAVCEGLDDLGIRLSLTSNETRGTERRIDDPNSKVQIWIVPTNEELVVARQTVAAFQR